MMDVATLSTGGIIGFAVGITTAALLIAWGEKRNIKRLQNTIEKHWETRLSSIKVWAEKKYRISIEDVKFLLKVIDALRKD